MAAPIRALNVDGARPLTSAARPPGTAALGPPSIRGRGGARRGPLAIKALKKRSAGRTTGRSRRPKDFRIASPLTPFRPDIEPNAQIDV